MLSLNCKHVQHVKIKKGNNSKMSDGIYFKIAGWVDLDMPHIFCNLKLTFISYGFWNIRRTVLKFYKFDLYFKNYKRQMVSWNCKHVQYLKIYLPCNFEVNLITHLGVIALFSSFFFFYFKTFRLDLKKFLFLVMVAILDTGRHWQTQFWKGTT
jgi:hypothetical protein